VRLLPLLLTLVSAWPATAWACDTDGDGFDEVGCGGADCDDSDPTIFPGAPEVCDGVDSDCDGVPDGFDGDVGAYPGPTLPATQVVFAGWPDAGSLPDTITMVGALGPVADVNLEVWLLPDFADHTEVTLLSPSGTEVLLFTGLGAVGDHFVQTGLDDESALPITSGAGDFEDVYQPMQALSVFDGEPANGGWTLVVTDTVPNFSGGLFNEWTITLETLQPDDSDGDGAIDGCGDCDAGDPSIWPGAPEVCGDGVDQDCSGADDDGDFDGDGLPDDGDGDGVDWCSDCDDGDATVFPGAPETCDDGVDQDCDGLDLPADADDDGADALACGGDDCADDDPLLNPTTDADGDGAHACEDCDDGEALVHPGGVEVCDGLDNDCDGQTDGDGDGDGYFICGDCDDTDATTFPGAPEACDDGVDQDCDGADTAADVDGDGHDSVACGGGDCDDGEAAIFPGAEEICDGTDYDCDGLADAVDVDGDYHFDADCGGDDCDDDAQGVHPDSVEACNGVDDDCDGEVDEELDDCGDDDDSAPLDDDDDADLVIEEPTGCDGCAARLAPSAPPTAALLPLVLLALRRRTRGDP
jgi:subtilisin-like proprotein convertase family protein